MLWDPVEAGPTVIHLTGGTFQAVVRCPHL